MTKFSKILKATAAAALMWAGISTGAQAFMGAIGGLSMEDRGMALKGQVVCTKCSVEEVRKATLSHSNYYVLSHKEGQTVIKVDKTSNDERWGRLSVPYLWVRAQDSMLAQLAAADSVTKEVEIYGTLSNARVLDVNGLTVVR